MAAGQHSDEDSVVWPLFALSVEQSALIDGSGWALEAIMIWTNQKVTKHYDFIVKIILKSRTTSPKQV